MAILAVAAASCSRPVPNGDVSSVKIRLERSACFGPCPAYSVTLRGDGTGLYDGRLFVLVDGEHRLTVDPQRIAALVDQFRSAHFWSLKNDYSAAITDHPTTKLTLEIGGRSKTVTDYAGIQAGMPAAVTAPERAVDEAAGVSHLVRGDDQTLALLQAEAFQPQSGGGDCWPTPRRSRRRAWL